MPRSWTDDAERCRAAGIPDGLTFATKPVLAAWKFARALDAGTPSCWVAGRRWTVEEASLPTAGGRAGVTGYFSWPV